MGRMRLHWILPATSAAMLVPGLTVHGQSACTASATIASSTVVYSQPPQFSTRKGWSLEAVVDTLRAGGTVRVCARRRIGLLVGAQQWLAVQYPKRGRTLSGWIPQERTNRSRTVASLTALLLPKVAHAAAAQTNQSLEGSTPPALGFYLFLFLAVILGMAAKGLYDCIDQKPFLFGLYCRNMVRAFVVAPIVFYAIAGVGDFGIASAAGVFTYALMAFQNGFFWQTVLARQTA